MTSNREISKSKPGQQQLTRQQSQPASQQPRQQSQSPSQEQLRKQAQPSRAIPESKRS